MSYEPPFSLGPFIVDLTGHLSPRDPEHPPAFGFAWRDRAVHACLDRSRVALSVTLGRVPSTAAAGSDAQRPRSFATLRALPPVLPDGWRLSLLADHRVQLDMEADFPEPATAAGLLTLLTGFVLALEPYLDLLDEDGVIPAAAAGKASTCPG